MPTAFITPHGESVPAGWSSVRPGHSLSDVSTSRRGWPRTFGIAFVVWTALAVLSMLQVRLASSGHGTPMPWQAIVPSRLLDWYTCALFTPVFLWLVRVYPLDAARWVRRMPLY